MVRVRTICSFLCLNINFILTFCQDTIRIQVQGEDVSTSESQDCLGGSGADPRWRTRVTVTDEAEFVNWNVDLNSISSSGYQGGVFQELINDKVISSSNDLIIELDAFEEDNSFCDVPFTGDGPNDGECGGFGGRVTHPITSLSSCQAHSVEITRICSSDDATITWKSLIRYYYEFVHFGGGKISCSSDPGDPGVTPSATGPPTPFPTGFPFLNGNPTILDTTPFPTFSPVPTVPIAPTEPIGSGLSGGTIAIISMGSVIALVSWGAVVFFLKRKGQASGTEGASDAKIVPNDLLNPNQFTPGGFNFPSRSTGYETSSPGVSVASSNPTFNQNQYTPGGFSTPSNSPGYTRAPPGLGFSRESLMNYDTKSWVQKARSNHSVPKNSPKMTATYDFYAQGADELTALQGHQLACLDQKDDWYVAKNLQTGEIGLIPSSIVRFV